MAESLYKRRLAAGLCGMCGKVPPLPGKSLCAADAEKCRLRTEAKREKRNAAGLCPDCGGKNPKPKLPGKSRCAEHLAKLAACEKRQADQRREAGECPHCGGLHGKPKPGYLMCQHCIDESSAGSSKAYAKRKEAGTCYYCNRPRVPGMHACAYHMEKSRDHNRDIKLAVFKAYGGAKCVGCGETDLFFLELDHVNHDGAAERAADKNKGSTNLYWKLKNQGFPDRERYRVLCKKCNWRAEIAYRQREPDPFTGKYFEGRMPYDQVKV